MTFWFETLKGVHEVVSCYSVVYANANASRLMSVYCETHHNWGHRRIACITIWDTRTYELWQFPLAGAGGGVSAKQIQKKFAEFARGENDKGNEFVNAHFFIQKEEQPVRFRFSVHGRRSHVHDVDSRNALKKAYRKAMASLSEED